MAGLGKPDIRCTLLELAKCGLCGLLLARLLPTQRTFAFAASFNWQCSMFHRTSHSNASIQANLKLIFRCGLPQQSRPGQSGLLPPQRMQVQKAQRDTRMCKNET